MDYDASGRDQFLIKVWMELVRAEGLEPSQASRPYGFSYHFGFRRRLQ